MTTLAELRQKRPIESGWASAAWWSSTASLEEALAAAETEQDRLRAELRTLQDAVARACEHDRECEEEGEGACCFRAWRTVVLLAHAAPCLTDEDEELVREARGG